MTLLIYVFIAKRGIPHLKYAHVNGCVLFWRYGEHCVLKQIGQLLCSQDTRKHSSRFPESRPEMNVLYDLTFSI
jgi:hypothetical protein